MRENWQVEMMNTIDKSVKVKLVGVMIRGRWGAEIILDCGDICVVAESAIV